MVAAMNAFAWPQRATRNGFTLIEILTVILVLSLGLTSIIGVMALANRQALTAIDRYAAMATAWSLVHDHVPFGRTADAADADSDGWRGTGSCSLAAASYALETQGSANGFFLVRSERSSSADRIGPNARWADVTVEVFRGRDGGQVTVIRDRIIRERALP
jgi:prepilin-type N-terminal cleavage/methylation domain-containing protein